MYATWTRDQLLVLLEHRWERICRLKKRCFVQRMKRVEAQQQNARLRPALDLAAIAEEYIATIPIEPVATNEYPGELRNLTKHYLRGFVAWYERQRR